MTIKMDYIGKKIKLKIMYKKILFQLSSTFSSALFEVLFLSGSSVLHVPHSISIDIYAFVNGS